MMMMASRWRPFQAIYMPICWRPFQCIYSAAGGHSNAFICQSVKKFFAYMFNIQVTKNKM